MKLEHNLEGRHWEETWETEDMLGAWGRFRAWLQWGSACMAGMEPWLPSTALNKLVLTYSTSTGKVKAGRSKVQGYSRPHTKFKERKKKNRLPNWYYTIQNASSSLTVSSAQLGRQSFLWLWIWLEYLSQRDWKSAQFYWTLPIAWLHGSDPLRFGDRSDLTSSVPATQRGWCVLPECSVQKGLFLPGTLSLMFHGDMEDSKIQQRSFWKTGISSQIQDLPHLCSVLSLVTWQQH